MNDHYLSGKQMLQVFSVLASLTALASAQEILISGQVMDGSNGVPLAGATVSMLDAELFTMTDAAVPSIADAAIFDQLDPSTMAWYVSISTDNRFLLFAKDGAIMQHDVTTSETIKVSADSDPYKAYPTYTTFSK